MNSAEPSRFTPPPILRPALASLLLISLLALAALLTLTPPGSSAVQAQEEPGAQAAEVTPAAATLSVSEVRYTTAVLTLSGHAGTWYYKANKAPHTSCTQAASNTLLGLTHNTQYTYTAYSDSACTTANELDDVTFTTLKKKLVLSDWGPYEPLGQNSATLDYQGFSANLAHLKGDAANPTNAPHSTCTKWTDVDDPRGSALPLTGLDPNTSYTYRGYEDSACATEVASITFTTLPAVLTARNLGLTTASLTLTGNLGRAFYYQADTAPHTACTLQGAGGGNYQSVALSGLATSTEYTYTAYTDSACSSANKLDDVTFTTLSVVPTLTVSYVSPTTAKLTMSEGWTGSWYFSAEAFESGRCDIGSIHGPNIAYLTGLTPGATYTFKAYARVSGVPNCTAQIAEVSVSFTTPTQLTECDGLSVAAGAVDNNSSSSWIRYVEVRNNTDKAIHDVRALTYYSGGRVSALSADPVYDAQHNAGELSELQPGATDEIRYTSPRSFSPALVEVNGVVQLVNPATSAVLCETAIEPSWWRKQPNSDAPKGPTNPSYWVSTQLDNPLPGAGENATFIVTAYAATRDQLLQACVNLHFDGVAPVDADLDGNHDVVIYDGPNGKYKEDGTLNSGGHRRAGRLDYDSDGYDEDVESFLHRPQCSDAAGNFEGGLFRIGNTERRTDSNGGKWPAGVSKRHTYYTVKIPVAATGSGSGCLTATVRALPPEVTDGPTHPDPITASEKAQNNTAKACLGAPPSGDPSLPVLFQEGRADLMTLRKCADSVNFPCAGKSVGAPVQYVNSGTDAASGDGSAAANAGSPYRAFRPTDVVVHVADSTDTRKALNNAASPAVKQIYWQSGHDVKNQGSLPVLPGVAAKWIMPRSEFPGKVFCSSAADRTPNGRPGGLTINDGLWASTRANWAYFFNFKDASSVNETDKTADDYQLDSDVNPYPLLLEFRTLGTYVMDWTTITKTSTNLDSDGYALDCRDATVPTDAGSADTGTYKFHVGPAADLRVYPGGDSASVASGKRAFTIVAESEATAEIDAEINVGDSLHPHYEQINLHTLIPAVTVTAGGAAIPAANVSQSAATAGAYDPAAGVWTLPEGFRGQATLTLVADTSAVSSVTAEIENSAEVCEDAAGNATSTVDGRAAIDRATCEFNSDGTTSSGNHWGSYQRCIKTDASAVGHDPDHNNYIVGKTACATNAATNKWHTTEVYDWRPNNNTTTFTPDARGFTLNARGRDYSSIELRWHKQAGADDYAIYSASTADLADTDNLGALLGANQVAVVSGDTTAYLHAGLATGQKRHYLIRARKDGRPFAMSNLAGATVEIPGQPWQSPRESRAPGSVGSLTAARAANNENVINVSWNAPSGGATGYDVQYRSRPGGSGSYTNWTNLATQQAATAYTFYNAGGGTSYQFQVRAVNVFGGQTSYGGWQTASVNPVSSPSQVRNLTATRLFTDETKIDVTWEAPSGGATPTSYDLEYRENGGAWTTAPNRIDTATTTYQLADAKGASSYQFRARAVTVTGGDTIYGSWRSSNTVPRVAAPGQVSNLRAERQFADVTKIDVTWTAPNNANSRTTYEVQHQRDGGQWISTSTVSTTTYTLDPASGNSRYVFRVRGVTTLSGGERLEGSWRSSNTVPKVAAPNQVGNLRATRQFADERDIVVTWTAPNNATSDTTYEVQRQEDGGAWSATSTISTTTYEFNDQAKGQSRYVFRVRGVTTLSGNDRLEGNWRSSNTVQRVPTPGQVGNLRATRNAANDAIIKVTWTAPGNATGATDYDVERKEDNNDWTGLTTVSGTTTYQYSQASGAKRYVFRVRAVTLSDGSDLTGNWRSSSAVPTLPAPNRVSNVKATRDAGNENRIVVSWSAPSGGTTPTGYEVQYKENNAGDWQPDTPRDVTGTTTAVFSDAAIIKGGSSYQFQVRAYKTLSGQDKLRGGWRSSNTVAGQPAGNIATTTATRSTSDPTTIDVVWTESERATVGYQVQHRKNNGGWTNATTTGPSARSYTKTDVGGVETHTFRVRGISGAGNGAWTESNQVGPPPLKHHGFVVGVDYVTIKMTSGPWYYDFRSHTGNWSGCKRVASGGKTLTNLWAETTYTVNLFSAKPDNCTRHDSTFMGQHQFKTLSDINNPDKCWNTDDCRNIDNPNDFNNHTHKRSRLAQSGNNLSNCDRVTHTHGWPNGGWGQHWHCRQ